MQKSASLACLLFLMNTPSVLAIVPFAVVAAMGSFGVAGGYLDGIWDSFFTTERCSEPFVPFNVSDGLKYDLKSKLHGQHLAISAVLSSVKAHMSDPNPKKPLVLSFQGGPGTGKTFVSQILVENIYKEGEKSQYVHRFYSHIHFNHESHINVYKENLKSWIHHNTSKCERSLFIFEDISRDFPKGLFDVLVPFLDYNIMVDGVDYRKAIFIFICNCGAEQITKTMLRHLDNGKGRDTVKLRDMQEDLQKIAFNDCVSFKHSEVIGRHLIDRYVPFLPLEREHIKMCIIDEFHRRNYSLTEENINDVLDELTWYSSKSGVYSKFGCKGICNKVNLVYEPGLKHDLKSKLHGQHLAISAVLSSVQAHMSDPNPKKALVLSFQGGPGTGKTFVSQILVENIYEGEKSQCVHRFYSHIHFNDENQINVYKENLKSWIHHNISTCERSIFMFDDTHETMPKELFDVLVPFLDSNTLVDGVDCRKAIFLFMSNCGAEEMSKTMLHHWDNGKSRDTVKLRDMQEVLQKISYIDCNILKHAKMNSRHHMDRYVPFLPLEREHIKKCIIDEFHRRNYAYTEENINDVLDELTWYPSKSGVYSKYGCKGIREAVDLVHEPDCARDI